MAVHKIYCRRVLLDGGWAQDQVLELDNTGMIGGIRESDGEVADVVLDGPVIPGMSNLHSHAFQRMIAGLTGAIHQGSDSFWGWRKAMYGFANRISPEQLEDCAAWLYAEMLCAGYTSCGEFHYLHHQPDGKPYSNLAENSERIVAAATRAGISLTMLPVFYKASGFGRDEVGQHQRRFANSLDDYLLLLDLVQARTDSTPLMTTGIAPHSLRAVPADQLLSLLNTADGRLPRHIHIAEQLAEVADCIEYLGARPVEWLLENANVDQRWCLVHATHMNFSEVQAAASSGAIAGLCPTTEADLGDGFFDTARWLKANGRFGIGSDSNLVVSPAGELRLLEFSERLRTHRRNVLHDGKSPCGQYLWQASARDGAAAIGQPAGSIAVGRRADLVELESGHPLLASRDAETILETLVFAGQSGMVRTVWVGGQQQVANGRHIDHERLAERFVRASKALVDG